jgi:hypothetical protein
MSQTRTDLTATITLRLQNLGYNFNANEIESIVNDVQKVIVTDNATAIADCTADVASFPPYPAQGG